MPFFRPLLTALAALCLAASAPALAQETTTPAAPSSQAGGAKAKGSDAWHHGLSLFGDVKYPADFKHYDYVNPDAPKGGRVRLSAFGGFDTFNLAIPRGEVAAGLNLIYDTLMSPSLDEPSSEYGLLAESVRYPADISSATYRLRPQARWHDGQPVTADDVIWSLDVLKKNSPFYAAYFRNVTSAEKTGEREVTFHFDEKGNRELPQILGQLIVLPRHWWTGKDEKGNPRDITKTTLEPPLGSGAYRIKSFTPGRSIVYERVADYWGRDLPVNVGTSNFGEISYDYYRDFAVALEAFKADQYDFRVENSAKNWATAYNFPARDDGRVALETYPTHDSGIMQAFAFNIRRPKFQDVRVRRAFNLAMNFEEMNRTFFYGQYARIGSYFQNTELASSGLPQGRELEILDSVKGQVPPEVFTAPYRNPVNGDNQAVRANLRAAMKLLNEAGWSVQEIGGRRVLANKDGKPFTVEFLLDQPTFERVVLLYKQALERLGMTVTLRTVDTAQYENRVNDRDFDIVVASWPESLSPGNEQREFWGSASADREGSRNLVGIKDPAVDKLIDQVIFAKSRDDLLAATHALDRVLLWNAYVVPQWTSTSLRYAYWKRFDHPSPLPRYSLGFPDIWWASSARAGAGSDADAPAPAPKATPDAKTAPTP